MIEKTGETYEVESSKKSKFYTVDLKKKTCTCPQFIYRMRRQGGECKHIIAVKEFVTKSSSDDFDEIIDFVKENVFVESVELIDKFGEDKVNELISHGELIEEHGKIRLL